MLAVGRATRKFKYEGTLGYTQTAVNVQSLCHPDERKDILILILMVLAWGGATNKFTNEGKLGYAHTAMNVQSICHPDEWKDI